MSALSETIAALLPPPSSSMVRPSLEETLSAILRPVLTEPVKEMSGTLGSEASISPISTPGPATIVKMGGCRFLLHHLRHGPHYHYGGKHSLVEGFQITVSPTVAAMNEFQDHTEAGKLKAVITPTGPPGGATAHRACGAASRLPWSGHTPAWIARGRSQRYRSSPVSRPAPSVIVLPTSRVTTRPSMSLSSLSLSPIFLISCPPLGRRPLPPLLECPGRGLHCILVSSGI